ncbi:MAG: hypothetical protein N3A69_06500 [Leptospiraceae bacterium]|nr:hypothetical protein [Leptospiraceae bacterium]
MKGIKNFTLLVFFTFCNVTQKEGLVNTTKDVERTYTLSFSAVHQKYYTDAKAQQLNEEETQEFFDKTLEKSNTCVRWSGESGSFKETT